VQNPAWSEARCPAFGSAASSFRCWPVRRSLEALLRQNAAGAEPLIDALFGHADFVGERFDVEDVLLLRAQRRERVGERLVELGPSPRETLLVRRQLAFDSSLRLPRQLLNLRYQINRRIVQLTKQLTDSAARAKGCRLAGGVRNQRSESNYVD
jgi:hypothetical protein